MAKDYTQQIAAFESDYRAAQIAVDTETAFLLKIEGQRVATGTAQKFIQAVAQEIQQQAHQAIAAVVTRCLTSVFDSPYTFRIAFEQKRGRTEARLLFVRDGREFDPLSSAGGGVVDVASFALRLACLMMHRPRLRRLLVMDEPMKMLSKQYISRFKELVVCLSKELDVQFIFVTHNVDFTCGKIIDIC